MKLDPGTTLRGDQIAEMLVEELMREYDAKMSPDDSPLSQLVRKTYHRGIHQGCLAALIRLAEYSADNVILVRKEVTPTDTP